MKLAIVSTWPPRRCGLASFAAWLRAGLSDARHGPLPVVAVSKRPGEFRYGPEVIFEIVQDDPESYREAARRLNQAAVDAVLLQHEYGIYGGQDGRMVLELASELEVPLITTAHTVRSEPTPSQREILSRLAYRSERVVVMARRAVTLMESVYGVPASKIVPIPHGVPAPPPARRVRELRRTLGARGRVLLMTLGLLGPGKGIELALEAVSLARKKCPEILYLVIGATHPGELAYRGEAYREALVRRTEALGLQEHVRFVNRYLDEDEVLAHMAAADIYITPYPGREQISSGTLAFAVGLGRPVISTPYAYAEELLSRGAGVLVPFGDAEAMARAIEELATDPSLREAVSERAARVGATMGWPRVARQYAALVAGLQETRTAHVEVKADVPSLRSR